ncbi:MAG TPA: phosphate ABC transporter permease subunit PstC [Clostridia bacterium]|nr:phosphate ABC transporter permease subunit PstC [Clostridia bacterium]
MTGRIKLEHLYTALLGISAGIFLLAFVAIGFFIFLQGYPVFKDPGPAGFLLGLEWSPGAGKFGVFPMLVGSIAVTLGALVLGVPFSLLTAVFLAEYAPKRAVSVLNPAIELLAGIPSVIYGLFGMTTVVPIVRALEKAFLTGQSAGAPATGFSLLAAVMILSIMIAPTVINMGVDALQAVPREFKEGSLALGATRWQTIKEVVLPVARSGIFTGIILGMGRAIGETMAVIMVAGNTALVPTSLFSPVRTLTSNIAIEIGYAAQGPHTQALYGTGIVLFVLIVLLNALAVKIAAQGGQVK